MIVWPLEVKHVHVAWSIEHDALPSLGPCNRALIRFERRGSALIASKNRDAQLRLDIESLNRRAPVTLDPSAVAALAVSVVECLEQFGLLGVRVDVKASLPAPRTGQRDLWLLVDVPLPGRRASEDIPDTLVPVKPPPIGDKVGQP